MAIICTLREVEWCPIYQILLLEKIPKHIYIYDNTVMVMKISKPMRLTGTEKKLNFSTIIIISQTD